MKTWGESIWFGGVFQAGTKRGGIQAERGEGEGLGRFKWHYFEYSEPRNAFKSDCFCVIITYENYASHQ